MSRKSTLIIAGLASAAAIAGGGMLATGAFAQTSTGSTGISGLVEKIATKFNLNQADVQAVFDEDKAAQDATRAADEKTRLDQAVTDGKITQAQEDLIIAKQAELRAQMEAKRESHQGLSETERKAAMEKERTDLQTWATANNIPMEYLHMGRGMGPGGDRGGDGPHGPNSASTSTSSTSSSTSSTTVQ